MYINLTRLQSSSRPLQRLLRFGCLSLLIAVFVCVGAILFVVIALPQLHAGSAADTYMNSIKTDKQIQPREFTNHAISAFSVSDDVLGGTIKAVFSGPVTNSDGHLDSVAITLLSYSFMNFTSDDWRVIQFDLGLTKTIIPRP